MTIRGICLIIVVFLLKESVTEERNVLIDMSLAVVLRGKVRITRRDFMGRGMNRPRKYWSK